MGASEQYIAKKLKLTPAELTQHYSTQLALGPEEANLRVAQTFFDMATSGDFPQMTLAWLKIRGGALWQETPNTVEDEADTLDQAKDKLLRLLNRGK